MDIRKNCIFCKIIRGEIPSKKHYECDEFIIIEDIAPQAKKHYLLVPKNHYAYLSEATAGDAATLGKALAKIPTLNLGTENGYRLILNQGEDGGQEVFHLHFHILFGEKLPSIIVK
ncbi:MAG: HIT domain-containing protein [Firmicutes bacterium]|nr:HIT domain-containing protein [Bacillota bacterium]